MKQPRNDITLGYVYHMNFMGVLAETVAEKIRVSIRTLYRRLAEIGGKNINTDTPFIQWPANEP